MNGDRANATSSDSTDVVQRARPLHGRTSGPTRRSTKGQWTTEEDEILRQAVHRFKGKNWKKIAECFKERTDVQCLHRWQKVLNPELVKGPWSKEEDEIIIQMVNRYGPKKWSTIAQALPGRIGKQCRERWHNHLNPSINKEAWTQEEELALIRAHQIYGNKWAELMKFLPGRTDNAIKNHWNSSVKKKLDQYLASGLLQQFQGLPHATLPSQSNASSCRVQHISEDDTVLNNGSEMEEVTQCSQGSTFIGSQSTSDMGSRILLMRDESTLAEECNVFDPGFCSISRSESHPIDTQADSLLITEVPHGVGGLTFNDNGSMNDWDSAVVNNWQISPEELSNMLSQDLGQFVQHLNGNNTQHTLPYPLQHSITNMVAGGFPSNRDICGVEQSVDPILQPSNYLVSEESTFASNSCYSLGSDMFTTLYAQEHSVPVEHHLTDVNDFSEENQEHSVPLEHHLTDVNDFSEENQEHDSVPHRYEGLIHVNESSNSPCREVTGQMQQGDDPPKVVDINHLGSASSHNVQTIVGKDLVLRDEHKDSRNLYYEPPRFPFLCCDLIPSGSDTLQEFSPLGTRQFWTSVNRFWDSPTGERSPDAVLKSAAKSYLCTPSILKKRNRDLVSPLSEKRMEKKFERDLNREQFSKLSSEFSRLDVMLDEIDKSSKDIERTVDIIEDKENRVPDTGQGERTEVNFIKGTTSAEARLPLTEVVAEISKNDGEGTDADVSNSDGGSKNYAIKCKVDDANCSKDADRDGASAEIASGLDHDAKSCLLSSPERFGIKRLEAATAVTSTSEATSASMISPGMCKMTDGCNLVMSQVRPSEIASMFGETPIRRNIESPSAWKSPWFISPFLLGSRVDTDISIEDYGLFASPKDKTFDAISLMKQLSEQTASAFANAQQVLGDETPETILKKKFSSKLKQEYRENNEIEHRDLEQQASHLSSIPSERRILDFSNCGTPEKEPSKNGKFSQAMFNSPPSYLLKNCR